jgi:DNA (cytosine-5)-methyltransferase 1
LKLAAYYNEIEPYAAEWLRNLIKAGHIADGEVDTRSIEIVEPDDIRGFTQCHFFAGIAGWSHALRLAGWADERPIWTGSCPCQPFSVAGKGAGTDDPRHLWPHFFRLIRACRPPVVMGEQVAGKAGYGWLDGVRTDLEGEGYACEGVDIPACAVNAPHIRQRLYWVADAESIGRRGRPHDEDEGRREQPSADPCEGSGDLVNAVCGGRQGDYGRRAEQQLEDADACVNMADAYSQRSQGQRADGDASGRRGSDVAASGLCDGTGNAWSHAEWATGADGKTRRVKSGVRLLAHGVSARVGRLRAYGNAIVPPLAAEVVKAFMESQE